MKPLSPTRRRIYFFILVVIFFALIPFLVLYTNGYRLNRKLEVVKTGGLYVSAPFPETEIYINNKLSRRSNIIQRGLFEQNLIPETYFAFVYKEGYWPWSKELTVYEGLVSEGHSFLIPKEPVLEEILPINPESKTKNADYAEVAKLFSQKGSLSLTASATSSVTRRDVLLVRDENIILAKWLGEKNSVPYYFCDTSRTECSTQSLIFSSPTQIKTFDFLPGRNDVIVIARRNGIYAIDADRRRMQNFALIYAGGNPDFRIDDNERFFVKDGEKFFRLSFEI